MKFLKLKKKSKIISRLCFFFVGFFFSFHFHSGGKKIHKKLIIQLFFYLYFLFLRKIKEDPLQVTLRSFKTRCAAPSSLSFSEKCGHATTLTY
ncbi:unnamed protein product [Rhizophagus irregularis]|nr:unnamed protein product [Rhizophagus irregularis]